MKSTLADNIQLFNVKQIASSGLTPGEIPEGQTGIIDSSTGLTISGSTTFASLPEKISIVSKINGEVYYSFDDIEKSRIQKVAKIDKSEGQPNIWKTKITNCGCLKDIVLNINIHDFELIQRDGMTWTHRDMVYELRSSEMACECKTSGANPVFENNVITMMLNKKIQESKSPFYTSYVGVDTEEIVSGNDLPGSAEEGDLYILEGTGLHLYMGGNWEEIGDEEGIIEDVEGFVEFMKLVNLDEDAEDGPMLELYIEGANRPMPNYNDLEVNYVYPRGTKLTPGILVRDENTTVAFEEVQALKYDEGAGYDLRSLEWDKMSYYTQLNHRPQICGGIAHKNLKYQFENQTRYDVVSLEFDTLKVERNSGQTRLFGVVFGSEDPTIATNLYNMFNG